MQSKIDAHQHWLNNRTPRRLIMLVALASWIQPATSGWLFHDDEPGPQSFKEIVQRLVRASRENLRPVRTFRVEMHPSGDYWYEVEVKLPRAKICRIYEHPKMVYRCEWKSSSNLPINAIYTDVVKHIEEALGSTDWSVPKSLNGARVTRFEPVNPRRNPVFEVRLGGQRRDPIVEVLLFPVDRWGSLE